MPGSIGGLGLWLTLDFWSLGYDAVFSTKYSTIFFFKKNFHITHLFNFLLPLSGDSGNLCISLHTDHSHSCMCELQLCCLHDNTSMAKLICESTSTSTQLQCVFCNRVEKQVIAVCVVTVCGCRLSGNGSSEESQ